MLYDYLYKSKGSIIYSYFYAHKTISELKHKKLTTMIISTKQKSIAGVRVEGDFLLLAILYLLLLEPYNFFKNIVFKK